MNRIRRRRRFGVAFLLLLAGNISVAQELEIEQLDPNMTLKKADAKGIAWFDPREKPSRPTGFKWIGKDKVYRRLPAKPIDRIEGKRMAVLDYEADTYEKLKDTPGNFIDSSSALDARFAGCRSVDDYGRRLRFTMASATGAGRGIPKESSRSSNGVPPLNCEGVVRLSLMAYSVSLYTYRSCQCRM